MTSFPASIARPSRLGLSRSVHFGLGCDGAVLFHRSDAKVWVRRGGEVAGGAVSAGYGLRGEVSSKGMVVLSCVRKHGHALQHLGAGRADRRLGGTETGL